MSEAPLSAPDELAVFQRIVEFDAVRAQIAARAASDPGRALALELGPADSLAAARAAQARTTEAASFVALPADRLPALGGVPDVPRLFDFAERAKRTLDPVELSLLRTTARAGEGARASLEAAGPALRALLDGVDLAPLVAFAARVESSLTEDLELRDDASPELRSLREAVRGARAALEEATAEAAADPGVVSGLARQGFVVRNGRPCLAVKASHATRVAGALIDREPSGEVLYVEPLATVELANRALELELAERALVDRILGELHALAKENEPAFRELGRKLALLDLHLALGRFSKDLGMSAPRLVDEGPLALAKVRHPVLAERPSCVPIDVTLDSARRLLVISGPNGGGKTVALKTTGIACLLALAGAHVPAREAQVPRFDRLLAAAVAGDDLEHGLSTFEAHARRLAAVVAAATPRTLVLLDEVGLGTDPIEGAALGRALLEHLLALGARTLATTHLGPLKTFAASTEGAMNASVEVDERGRPLYRLTVGKAGESSALVVARRAGIPESIVARAEKILRGR